jgi:hypothetical protein
MSGRVAALIAFATVLLSSPDTLASEDPHLHFDNQSNCSLYDVEARPSLSASWSGSCAHGLASGRGTVMFARADQTQLTISTTFANGRAQDGDASIRWSGGVHFEGHWAHGAPNGRGSITWANGDRYDGKFANGRAEGQGTEIWANGDRYEGPWHNDVPDGLGTFTKKGGGAERIVFVDGKRQPRSGSVQAAASASDAPATPATGAKFFFLELAGKTLTGLDGSSIKLEAADGAVVRTIESPSGQSERVAFKILNGNLGTISEVDGSQHVTGFFRADGSALDAEYADGHREHFALNNGGGLTSLIVSPSGTGVCLSWYPDGHLFSKDERKAAVVAYARRLGVSFPASSSAPPLQCDSKLPASAVRNQAAPPVVRPMPKPIGEHASLPPYKLGEGPANLQIVPVHDSVVHPIDAPLTVTAAANNTAPVINEVFASNCLKMDTDGSYWGFRNHCGYSVQFAYCLLHGSDEAPSCGMNGSGTASGSVSASGFSTLFADLSFSSGSTEHDFRWVACRGGAGEVVPRLDVAEPAAGRCLKPTSHQQEASN